MTDTLETVAAEDEEVDQQQLLAQAREQRVDLVGPNGLVNQPIKRVLETALEEEMAEHLGYDKHDPVGRNHGNSRNGARAKTVLTEIGPVQIEVPRDTDASFQPQIYWVRPARGSATGRAPHGGRPLDVLRTGVGHWTCSARGVGHWTCSARRSATHCVQGVIADQRRRPVVGLRRFRLHQTGPPSAEQPTHNAGAEVPSIDCVPKTGFGGRLSPEPG
jgi:hypothetical protein